MASLGGRLFGRRNREESVPAEEQVNNAAAAANQTAENIRQEQAPTTEELLAQQRERIRMEVNSLAPGGEVWHREQYLQATGADRRARVHTRPDFQDPGILQALEGTYVRDVYMCLNHQLPGIAGHYPFDSIDVSIIEVMHGGPMDVRLEVRVGGDTMVTAFPVPWRPGAPVAHEAVQEFSTNLRRALSETYERWIRAFGDANRPMRRLAMSDHPTMDHRPDTLERTLRMRFTNSEYDPAVLQYGFQGDNPATRPGAWRSPPPHPNTVRAQNDAQGGQLRPQSSEERQNDREYRSEVNLLEERPRAPQGEVLSETGGVQEVLRPPEPQVPADMEIDSP
jgi:hypothetical protein